MRKISSKTTFMIKRVFPVCWFGLIGCVFIASLIGGAWRRAPAMLIIPLVMAGFGFLIMQRLVWDLMDEVYDYGDHLLIRNGGEEAVVRLADVVNVSSVSYVNPPRITLRLSTPCKFGTNVTFSPAKSFFFRPFADNPIADDLIDRVDAARRSTNPGRTRVI